MVWIALIASVTFALHACGDDPSPVETEPCVDHRDAYAFPSPAWTASGSFAPPADDRVAGLLLDRAHPWPEWHDFLEEVPGWPRRPFFAVPLTASGASIDPTGLTLFGRSAAEPSWRAVDVGLQTRVDGSTLLVGLDRPLPPGLDQAALAIAAGAISGAEARAVCDNSGAPFPIYAETREAIAASGEYDFALPIELSAAHLPLERLAESISPTDLQVAEVAARELSSFGINLPSAVTTNVRPTAAAGLLDLPDYRDPEGTWVLDATGTPIAGGTTRPGFIVLLPQNGTPPFPVVLFQHGGESNKEDVLLHAGPFAEAGFALVAIDLLHHGDRGEPGSSFLSFIDFERPFFTRDSFRQTSADQMAVLAGMAQLDAAIGPVVGVEPALDPERLFLTGASLGAVTGGVTFTLTPELQGAALFVGGAGFTELGSYSVFSLMIYRILERPPLERDLTLAMMEVLLNGADAFAYAQHTEDRDSPPRPVLLMQADQDTIVAQAATENLARAFGASLARPFLYSVEGLSEVSLPAAGTFAWSAGSAAATRVLIQFPMNDLPINDHHRGLAQQDYAQEIAAHCFIGELEQGRCEVADNGFAER